MYDCIYTAHCTRNRCDQACPVRAEIGYWMDRCKISMNNPVLKIDQEQLRKCTELLENNAGKVNVYRAKNTVATADLFCYCAICMHGSNTGLTHGVYNLNFSAFLDETKKSWQTKYESETLEFMKIWTDSSSYLIISHLDYINFGDFESQMLLTIMQSRREADKSTYIITPSSGNLIGKGNGFYPRLLDELKGAEIV